MRQQQTGDQMQQITQEAERLAQQQESFDQRMKKTFGSGQNADQNKQQISGQMAGEKDKMAEDYAKLEKDMQQAARGLSGTQPDASRKLRDAMGELQQEGIGNRMKW